MNPSVDLYRKLWIFKYAPRFKDDTSSIMHPTAEGHAENADANVKIIK